MNVYEQVLSKLKDDDRILACALGGSRSTQQQTTSSDYDIFCIVKDSEFEAFKRQFVSTLESIENIIFAVKSDYQENMGYIFKALSLGGDSFDIRIIPLARIDEMAIRSTNIVLFDTENIYQNHVDIANDSLYDPSTIQEKRMNDYLKLCIFEYLQLQKAIINNDYSFAVCSLERIKTYYIRYIRAFLGVAPKPYHFPEKRYDFDIDPLYKNKYIIDGKMDTLINVCNVLFSDIFRVSTEKKILKTIFKDKVKYTSPVKIVFLDMEYDRDELNEPINIYVLLQCLSNDVTDNVDIQTICRQTDNEDESQVEIIDNADILLISSKVSTENVLDKIIEKYKKKPVILGGIVANHRYDDIISKYENVICVIGEGETNIDSILRHFIFYREYTAFKEALRIHDVPNLYFKWDGKVIATKRCYSDLLQVRKKPLFHPSIKDIIIKKGMARIEGSRGCPWNKCSFCVIKWKYNGRQWAEFPIEYVVDEIVHLSEQGIKTLYFTDEDFFGSLEHTTKLFSKILEHKNKGSINSKIKFWGSTSVLTLKSFGSTLHQTLKMLISAGVQGLFIGIESGSDSQLKRFNKGVTAQENSEILAILMMYGFIVDAGFIMFDPEVTINEIAENMVFIKETHLSTSTSRLAKKLRVVSHTDLHAKYISINLPLIYRGFDINLDYQFINQDVRIIIKWLDEIGKKISSETHYLQANIRGDSEKWNDPESVNKLIFLRNIEYSFIDKCLIYYKQHKKLNNSAVESIYRDIVVKLKGNL